MIAPRPWRRTAPESVGLRRLSIGLAFAAAVFSCLDGGIAQAASAPPLSAADAKQAKAAFKAIDKNQWKSARNYAAKAKNLLVAKIVKWMDSSRSGSTVGYSEISSFLKTNPGWPRQSKLREQAEAKIPSKTEPKEVLDWFSKYPPIGSEGHIRFAAALLADGQKEEGAKAVRETWINGNFGKRQEKSFYRRYRKHLTRADHVARLERLIWDDRYWPARRMLWRVDPGTRALGEARLMLMRRNGNVDKAIKKVPAELKSHSGLVYERLRWRRRKGRYDSARELIDPPPPDPLHPEKWWIERDVIARKALYNGHISEAYRIAKNHGINPKNGHVRQFAEAEWLAGWIASRFLQDHAEALDHFVAMYKAVQYPVSRARGAYWAGRAAEALKSERMAKMWYRIASRFQTTYYGQLAAVQLDPGGEFKLPNVSKPPEAEMEAFEDHELVRAVLILHQAGAEKTIKPFILTLAEHSEAANWQAMTAGLARVAGRPDLAIQVAKAASRNGHALVKAGYPTIELPPTRGKAEAVERPLILAVVRQESAYWP
ncbi:MAG: lytic transglycosylase domain-containing protein, partial [Rhodospirillales bacterium]|nr:lytic transglycosylase domain-containing protein [Rhodospirillales bacterium]